jgi:hypothetical protein
VSGKAAPGLKNSPCTDVFPVYLTSRPARARSCANAPASLIRLRGEIFAQLPPRKARTTSAESERSDVQNGNPVIVKEYVRPIPSVHWLEPPDGPDTIGELAVGPTSLSYSMKP